jgi:hypothetical protein
MHDPLPKKMNKREADLTPKVVEKLKKLHKFRNWALEVKMVGNKLAEHQKKALKQVEDGRFTYKIPDQGMRNPFDVIHLGDADAIVCYIDGETRKVDCQVNGGVLEYNFKI